MAQRRSSGGVYPWLVTALGLGLVWGTIVTSFPSLEDLTAIDPPRAAAAPVPPPVAAPALDLAIPQSVLLRADDVIR